MATRDRGLTLTVIGCGGSSYDPTRALPCSSYLLESSEATLLLDCGYGSFDSLRALRPQVQLDAIILSHGHADHVGDLATFVGAASLWRTAPQLLAARSTLERASFDVTTLGAGSVDEVRDGDLITAPWFEAEFSSTTHQIPTLAVQVFMGGSRVVYSADTGPNWLFPASFRDADLAMVECTFEERRRSSAPFHLDAHEVAELLEDLSPLAALVTHVPPDEDGERRRDIVERLALTLRRVDLAVTGLTIELGRDGSL